MQRILFAATFALLPAFAGAHEYTTGSIMVIHPKAFETAPTAKVAGGFLTISNEGTEADALIAIRADFERVELHESIETDGVAKMQHVERVEIPAGETVELAPGGYHVMFMGLNGDPFELGEEIPATLVFEKAGELPVHFNVESRGDAPMADHSKH